MLSMISFVFTYWYVFVLLAGLATAAAWYTGLLAVRDIVVNVRDFIRSRVGMALICLVVGAGAGWMSNNNDLAVERLRSANEALLWDLGKAQDAKADAEARAEKLDKETALNDEKVEAIERELAALRNQPPADPKVIVKTTTLRSCPANPEAVRRLLEIK